MRTNERVWSAHTGNLAIVTKPFSLAEGVGSGDENNQMWIDVQL